MDPLWSGSILVTGDHHGDMETLESGFQVKSHDDIQGVKSGQNRRLQFQSGIETACSPQEHTSICDDSSGTLDSQSSRCGESERSDR